MLQKQLKRVLDAFLRQSKGSTHKAVAASVTLKLAAMSATGPAMMSLAAFFGTASTGTAISSLSGAAFSNAALAWLGGSVAAGGLLIGGVTIATMFGAGLASKKVKEYFSNDRCVEDLPEDERVIADGIFGILTRLGGQPVTSPVLLSLWSQNLSPMIVQINALMDTRFGDWRSNDVKSLRRSIIALKRLNTKTQFRLSNSAQFSISAFAASVTKLFLEVTKFTEHDWLVMAAFRRSTTALPDDASPEMIAAYIRGFDSVEQRQGMLSNVKGIYHEVAYAEKENSDGDRWFVELSTKTNEPGVDAWMINKDTDERIPYQLKATDSSSSIDTQYDTYPDVMIAATDEVAGSREDVESTGFTNAGLNEQVSQTTEKLAAEGTAGQIIEESATAAMAAGFITFSINLGAELKSGKKLRQSSLDALKPAKQSLLIGATLAAVTELML